MNTLLMLGDISVSGGGGGDSLVHQLFAILIIGLCVALIWWVARWLCVQMAAPPAAMKIVNAIFVIIGLIVALNFLMGLGGKAFIHY